MYEKIKEFLQDNIELFNGLAELAEIIEPSDIQYPMEMFDDMYEYLSPLEIAEMVYGSDFDPNDNYFSHDVYLFSYDERDYSDYITSYNIERLADTVEREYYRRADYELDLLYDLYVEEGLIEGIGIDDDEVELDPVTEEPLTNELSALDGIASDFDEE